MDNRKSLADFLSLDCSPNLCDRVVIPVNYSLLQLDDCIIGDLDSSRTYLSTTACDVTVFYSEFLLDFRDSVFLIKRVHFVLCKSNQVSRPCKLVKHLMISENVTCVHAQETFDALSELLNSVSFSLIELPVHLFWSLDWLNSLGNFVVP